MDSHFQTLTHSIGLHHIAVGCMKLWNSAYPWYDFAAEIHKNQKWCKYSKKYSGQIVEKRCLAQRSGIEKQNQSRRKQDDFSDIDAYNAQLHRIFVSCFDSNACLIEWIDFDQFLFANVHHIKRENRPLIVIMGLYFVRWFALELNKIIVFDIDAESKALKNSCNRFTLSSKTINL